MARQSPRQWLIKGKKHTLLHAPKKAPQAQNPRMAWRGRSPSNLNPQRRHVRREDGFLRSGACPAGVKILSLQFEVDLPLANRSRLWRDALVQIKDLKQRALRPKNAAAFLAKTVNLLRRDQ
ncbi:MAG: hypothetical protein II875_01500 [Clostridia bacterium]|nr:hypothetical protein [Clostridia bacterium]